ncbi:DUF4352 domain-containing protein [Candidatus Saccharibacteria bacterium]|nr:DUF4352 domain-containing protein [Candidatus Saccharibacteria bacterium]
MDNNQNPTNTNFNPNDSPGITTPNNVQPQAPIDPIQQPNSSLSPQQPLQPQSPIQPQVTPTPQQTMPPQQVDANFVQQQPIQPEMAQQQVTPQPQVTGQQVAQPPIQPQTPQPSAYPQQPGMAPMQGQPQMQNPMPQNKKTPLVTLVAKLTFRGDNNNVPQTKLTKLLGIIFVVIAFAGSGVNIYAARHVASSRQALKEYSNPNAAQREKDKKQALKDSETEIQDLNDGQLDVSKLFDGTLAQRPQDIKPEYNKQVNLSNGATLAVLESKRGWDNGDKYSKPASGKEYILIKVAVGNRAKSGSKYMSTGSFQLLNSKGGLQDTRFVNTDSLGDDGFKNSGSLNPGDKLVGYLVFEVDKGEAVTLIYEDKGYDYDSSGKEFSMKVSVDIKQ